MVKQKSVTFIVAILLTTAFFTVIFADSARADEDEWDDIETHNDKNLYFQQSESLETYHYNYTTPANVNIQDDLIYIGEHQDDVALMARGRDVIHTTVLGEDGGENELVLINVDVHAVGTAEEIFFHNDEEDANQKRWFSTNRLNISAKIPQSAPQGTSVNELR